MIEYVDYFGHIAYTLIFFSFVVRRMLFLRVLAIAAGIFSIGFNYYVPQEPLWTPIYWNILFISTNLFKIALIIINKRSINFKGHNKYLYENIFMSFTPVEFKKILKAGHLRTTDKGMKLIDDHCQMTGLMLLVEGSVEVKKDEKILTTLTPGNFLGEMSFLTNDESRASVVTSSTVKYYSWDKQDLTSFLTKDPNLNAKFTGILGRQIIEQLMAKSRKEALDIAA